MPCISLSRTQELWEDKAVKYTPVSDDVTLVTKPKFVVRQSSIPKIPVNLSFQE